MFQLPSFEGHYGPSLIYDVYRITGIPLKILNHEKDVDAMSIAQRLSWAADRETTRIEDQAYCLLGLFRINMPLLYGEGRKAFLRLQEEIVRHSNDMSLLVWSVTEQSMRIGYQGIRQCRVLADCPKYFKKVDHHAERWNIISFPQTITNNGLEIRTNLYKTKQNCGRVLLPLNYKREKKRVFIRLIEFVPNIYERASWDDSELKDQEWELIEDQLIYVLTGLENGRSTHLVQRTKQASSEVVPSQFPADRLHPRVLLL